MVFGSKTYFESFGVCGTLKYLKTICNSFFFILEHALKNFGACTEHRLQVVSNKGGSRVAFVCVESGKVVS